MVLLCRWDEDNGATFVRSFLLLVCPSATTIRPHSLINKIIRRCHLTNLPLLLSRWMNEWMTNKRIGLSRSNPNWIEASTKTRYKTMICPIKVTRQFLSCRPSNWSLIRTNEQVSDEIVNCSDTSTTDVHETMIRRPSISIWLEWHTLHDIVSSRLIDRF